MRKLTAIILLATLTLTRCTDGEPATSFQPKQPATADTIRPSAPLLSDYLKKYEVPSQRFTVPGNKPSEVKGKKGTRIKLDPSDLETLAGQPVQQAIEVELKELTNQSELLRSNTPTVSNGRLLVSGGAYYINMTSAGQQLQLKKGKTLAVVFPKLTDEGMELFYGQRDSEERMNWLPAHAKFVSTPARKDTAVAPASPTKPAAAAQEEVDSRNSIDDIIAYIEEGHTDATPEDRVRTEKNKRNAKVEQKVYEAIQLHSFGWINCDRFLDIANKTNVLAIINPKDSISNANIYLVFKDLNSVMQEFYFNTAGKGNSVQFNEIPVGQQVRLIAYTVKEEQVYAFSTDVRVAKNQKIDLTLRPIAETDFKKLLNN